MKKQSFFQRLTGTINSDTDTLLEEESAEMSNEDRFMNDADDESSQSVSELMQEEEKDAELAVDVLQTGDTIIIQTMVAGVQPDDLDVVIGREMVTIKGARQKDINDAGGDYFHEELYWGRFSRTVMLPAEVETEEAEAEYNNGLLTIHLPKIDKDKEMKLKVKVTH